MAINPKLFWFFFISVFLPTVVGISVGSMRLSLYRIALIIFLLTSAKYVLNACKPSLKNPAFFMLAYGLWVFIALSVNHGMGQVVETSGIYIIETVGPFVIILAFCTTTQRIKKLVNLYILLVCFSLLITIPENLTNINWLKKLLDPVFPSAPQGIEKRMGLYRAAGSFDHPILQGVVASTAAGLAWFYAGIPRFILVVAAACTSVSSGAIVALYIQFMVMGWDRITRSLNNRWMILAGLIIVGYIAVDLISNRSAMRAILGNLTMSPHTAYWRLTIWDYGLQNANANPVFGIGFHDWDRPRWMYSGSMDAFWLVSMVRYGYVGFFLYATAILLVIRRLFALKLKNPELVALRRGWLVGMVGLIIASCTVHLWNNAYVFFNLYVGIGAAMYVVFVKEQKMERKKKEEAISPNARLELPR